MFYRMKFDGVVGGVLKRCGFGSSAAMDFWPVGATPEWIKMGKSKGWKPAEAAALGVSQIAIERLESGEISFRDAQCLAHTAHQAAQESGARDEVADHLFHIAFVEMPDVHH